MKGRTNPRVRVGKRGSITRGVDTFMANPRRDWSVPCKPVRGETLIAEAIKTKLRQRVLDVLGRRVAEVEKP